MVKATRQEDPPHLEVERTYNVTDSQLRILLKEESKEIIKEVFQENITNIKNEIYSEMKTDGKVFLGNLMITQGAKFLFWVMGTIGIIIISLGIKFGLIKIQF